MIDWIDKINWLEIKDYKFNDGDGVFLLESNIDDWRIEITIGVWSESYQNFLVEDDQLSCAKYWYPITNQPERSKREDSQKCEMRCSEHCGNTVRDK